MRVETEHKRAISRPWVVGVAICLVALSFAAVRSWTTAGAPTGPAFSAEREITKEAEARTSPARIADLKARLRRSAPGPFKTSVSRGEEGDDIRSREESRRLMGNLIQRLEASPHHGQNLPELTAVSIQEYTREWVESFRSSSADLVPALAELITGRLCDSGIGDEEAMLLGKVGLLMPEITTQRGFDCFFAHHTKEDPLLWSILDSWRHSGHGKSAPIAALEAAARDSRTHRRFMTASEELALRSPAGARGEGPIPSSR